MDTNDQELEKIYALAKQCRNLIETCQLDDLSVQMSCFPSGSCEPACLLLGAWLLKHGETGFQLKCCHWTESGGIHWTHVWLQRDDLIVDITADQFDSSHDGVIVSRTSAWHHVLSSKGQVKDVAPFEWPTDVVNDYSKIFGDT